MPLGWGALPRLSSSDLAALPPEVAAAHAAGRTAPWRNQGSSDDNVLFLPLRAPGLATAIGQEMDELSLQGRASLLSVICARLEEGPIYLGFCPALSEPRRSMISNLERWQLVLGSHGALRLLLKSLGMEPPTRVQLAEAALQRQLKEVPCVPWNPLERLKSCAPPALPPTKAPASPAAYCCWAVGAPGIMAVCHALKNLGTCSSLEAAEALVKLQGQEARSGLGALLLAPADDEMRPPPALKCPTWWNASKVFLERPLCLLGVGSQLVTGGRCGGQDATKAATEAANLAAGGLPRRASEEVGGAPGRLGDGKTLEGLETGAQPRRPADWRQERVPADLAFSLGQELGSDGARSLWMSLLDEKAVPDAVFRCLAAWSRAADEGSSRYAVRRLSHAADRAWLSELPARAKLRVRELFLPLPLVYWPVAGAALQLGGVGWGPRMTGRIGCFSASVGGVDSALDAGVEAPRNGLYLDLPRLGAAEGRGFHLQQCLRGLGARAHLDIEGLAAALEALLRGLCRLPAHFARIYSNIDTLETTAEPGARGGHVTEEAAMRLCKLCHLSEALPEPVKVNDCVWELPKNELLAQCCSLTVLRDIYSTFGDVQLKRYFEARGVPAMPNTAESYLRMSQNLMDAAEAVGIRAADFLNQVWDALLFIYKGMSSLEGQQRDALRPFSPVHTLLVPLPCPQGGPPQVSSMLEVQVPLVRGNHHGKGDPVALDAAKHQALLAMPQVARFYDGALFRRISVCESFWEVAPDLADSPAAAWAMSLAFPAELKALFVECFGVREARGRIMARLNHGKRGGMSRRLPGGFGSFGGELGSKAVNEQLAGSRGLAPGTVALGLPDELLRALGGDGRGGNEGDALAAAEEDALVAPALPARSVRCPAAPERRLRRAGHARGRRGERMAVYRVQRLEMRGLELARGYDASQKELDDLAVVLQNLVSVFRLDPDCVAIVNGDVVTTQQDDKGECHHGARRHWPLLFSAGLRPAAESSFWFGEFCHALAHRSTGPGHGAHHSRVLGAARCQG
eukprot:Skav231638  [mRNA]  locus=scaffold1135:173981:200700:+ [translate_table: standard]